MYQASTPTHTFTFSEDINLLFKDITVTYLQNKKIILEKTLKDFTVNGNVLSLDLTQEETIMFSPFAEVRIELLPITENGKVLPKVFDNIPVEEIQNKKVYDV